VEIKTKSNALREDQLLSIIAAILISGEDISITDAVGKAQAIRQEVRENNNLRRGKNA
jgi:hypothetical protein